MRGLETDKLLIRNLLNPAIYGVGSVELVETHISWVLLAGEFAYKVKKPVQLPFLDFTTLAARHHFCKEELRLNRRLAPELYLDVVPIGGSAASPRLGELPAIEYAVKMRQFEADARLDRRIVANAVGDEEITGFAERIAAFHTALPAAEPDAVYGTPSEVVAVVMQNFDEAAAVIPGALEKDGAIHGYLARAGQGLAAQLQRRKQLGRIKEGHGDLHLENLVLWEGRILPFDCLEFDPALRWIDVVDEAAFVSMDLMAHGRDDLAYRFLTRYVEITGDTDGLLVLRYYLVHRALVRAKVRAIKAAQAPGTPQQPIPGPYLALAERLVARRIPVLAITHGLSGSGKTTWTEHLLAALPAIRLRSDVTRKRLAALDEHGLSHSPVGGGIYAAEQTEATYAALADGAEAGLRAGFDIIVDAAFLRSEQRCAFADLARRADARFVILDCAAPVDVLRRRIASRQARGHDASEATIAVLDHQLAHHDRLSATERARSVTIETAAHPSVDEILASIRAARC